MFLVDWWYSALASLGKHPQKSAFGGMGARVRSVGFRIRSGRERPPRTRAFFWPWTSPTVIPRWWSEPNAIGLQLLQIPGLDTSEKEAGCFNGRVAVVWEVSNKSLSQKCGRTDSGEERKHSETPRPVRPVGYRYRKELGARISSDTGIGSYYEMQ